MTNNVNPNIINDIKISLAILIYLFNEKIILYESNYLFI